MHRLQLRIALAALILSGGCTVFTDEPYEFVANECTNVAECALAPFASPACVAGRCVLDCEANRVDCDGVYLTGCEADFLSVDSCGGCDVVCEDMPGNDVSCVDMACLVECNADEFLDCDGDPSNGCEVDQATPANCGACGNRCAAGEFCSSDVDGFRCVSDCGLLMMCDMTCADVATNRRHCGRCDNLCGNENTNAPSQCVGGACVLDCQVGFEDCDGDPSNGCETSITTLTDCGGCGETCDGEHAEWQCEVIGDGAACAVSMCADEFRDCNAEPMDGCETACGTAGTTSTGCAGGACTLTCEADRADCNLDPFDGCETPLGSLTNCGTCGDVCDEGWRCGAGSCFDPVVDIAPGLHHLCLVRASGETYCSGRNQSQQVQPAAFPHTLPAPARVNLPSGERFLATAISTGGLHSCAIDTMGLLFCWGANSRGQLGRASSNLVEPVEADPSETAVFATRRFHAISSHWRHTCAIDGSDEVWCWGDARNGALGASLGGVPRRAFRVDLSACTGAPVSISAGEDSTMTVMSDGTVCAWGDNTSGQLGVADTVALTPQTMPGVSNIVNASLGYRHSCMVTAAGQLYCVGAADQGRLGSPGPQTSTPRLVDLTNVVSVQTGHASTCAETDAGVFCWGRGSDGAVGLGDFTETHEMPAATSLAAGTALSPHGSWSHCAITEGIPYCWGHNLYGSLSAVADRDWNSPGAIVDRDGVPVPLQGITAGFQHGCGWTPDALWCWGPPSLTFQGGGPTRAASAHLPRRVTLPAGESGILGAAAGEGQTCFVTASHRAFCSFGGIARELVFDGEIDEIALGDRLVCIRAGGDVYCTGTDTFPMRNAIDQAFGGSDLDTKVPVQGLNDAVRITVGAGMGCALRGNGAVFCWGGTTGGDVRGDGSANDGHVQLPAGTTANNVETGRLHTCATLNTGEVVCWGGQLHGRLGNGLVGGPGADIPTYVVDEDGAPLTGAAQVAVTANTGCAVMIDRTLACWGRSAQRELGFVGTQPFAARRPGVTDAVTIAAGTLNAEHLCYTRTPDGGACIGARGAGRAGTASPRVRVSEPSPYQGLPGLSGVPE